MKTFMLCFLFFANHALATECRDILYRNSIPSDPGRCQKLGTKIYCCYEGGTQGEYANGNYYYRLPKNPYQDTPPKPTYCEDIAVCDSSRGNYGPSVCGTTKVCHYGHRLRIN